MVTIVLMFWCVALHLPHYQSPRFSAAVFMFVHQGFLNFLLESIATNPLDSLHGWLNFWSSPVKMSFNCAQVFVILTFNFVIWCGVVIHSFFLFGSGFLFGGFEAIPDWLGVTPGSALKSHSW